MAAAHFLIATDPAGGFDVCDTRCGESLAWRGDIRDAAELTSHLNACYPVGAPAPAYDSLVHEVRMLRIGSEPEAPLHLLDKGTMNRMVPCEVGDPRESELWARVLGLPDDEEEVV